MLTVADFMENNWSKDFQLFNETTLAVSSGKETLV